MAQVTPPISPELRADVLRVVLSLTDGLAGRVPAEAFELATSHGLRRMFAAAYGEEASQVVFRRGLNKRVRRDVAVMELASDDDLALVNACLQVEHELRQAEFAAVERLLALLPRDGIGGPLDYRLRRLDLSDFAAAAWCLYAAGWVDSLDST